MRSSIERIRKDIERLAVFTATPGAGVTRYSFSEEDRNARAYIRREMEDAGLRTYEDGAGNLFGRRDGRTNDAPPVMVGSHFDSVPNGGAFDGDAGVSTALEIARILRDERITTERPMEFAALVEEEGARFACGLYGSRAMTGLLGEAHLDTFTDRDGGTLRTVLRDFGFAPERFTTARREPGSIAAFLELHIEQGPVLETNGIDLGLVSAIVGVSQFEAELTGRADHAGSTPMTLRKDALAAAAEVVLALQAAARREGEGTVGTVGKMRVAPGGSNIVPEIVNFTMDIRSSVESRMMRIIAEMKALMERIAMRDALGWRMDEKVLIPPVSMHPEIVDALEASARNRGYSARRMVSGAGHDAMVMARLAPVGMVFVPSRGGRSHCPEEWTEYADVAKGADIMLDAALRIAGKAE